MRTRTLMNECQFPSTSPTSRIRCHHHQNYMSVKCRPVVSASGRLIGESCRVSPASTAIRPPTMRCCAPHIDTFRRSTPQPKHKSKLVMQISQMQDVERYLNFIKTPRLDAYSPVAHRPAPARNCAQPRLTQHYFYDASFHTRIVGAMRVSRSTPARLRKGTTAL